MAKRRLPTFLRGDEAERLIAAAPSARGRLLLMLGLFAGLRVSEMVHLRVQDVDLDDGQLFVVAGKGDRDRNLPIATALREPLRAWIGERRQGWLFPSPRGPRPLTRLTVNRLVWQCCKDTGITRRVSPHTLRHTFASELLRRGADIYEISQILGHSSIQVTSVYLHANPERLRSAIARLD